MILHAPAGRPRLMSGLPPKGTRDLTHDPLNSSPVPNLRRHLTSYLPCRCYSQSLRESYVRLSSRVHRPFRHCLCRCCFHWSTTLMTDKLRSTVRLPSPTPWPGIVPGRICLPERAHSLMQPETITKFKVEKSKRDLREATYRNHLPELVASLACGLSIEKPQR